MENETLHRISKHNGKSWNVSFVAIIVSKDESRFLIWRSSLKNISAAQCNSSPWIKDLRFILFLSEEIFFYLSTFSFYYLAYKSDIPSSSEDGMSLCIRSLSVKKIYTKLLCVPVIIDTADLRSISTSTANFLFIICEENWKRTRITLACIFSWEIME